MTHRWVGGIEKKFCLSTRHTPGPVILSFFVVWCITHIHLHTPNTVSDVLDQVIRSNRVHWPAYVMTTTPYVRQDVL